MPSRKSEPHSKARATDAADVAAVKADAAAVASAAEIKEIAEDARGVAVDSNVRIRHVESEVRQPFIKRMAKWAVVLLILYFVVTGELRTRQNTATLDELRDANATISANNETLTTTNELLVEGNSRLLEVATEQAELLREAGIAPVDPFDPGVTGPGLSPSRGPSPGTTQDAPARGSQSPSGGSNPGSGGSTPDEPQPAPSPSPGVRVTPPDTGLPLPLPSEVIVPLPDVPLGLSAASPIPLASKEDNRMDPNLINPWLTLLGLLLPIIVGAVTNGGASSAVKGWTLAALSGVAAVLAEWAEVTAAGTTFVWREVGMNLLVVFASSVVAYKGGLVSGVATRVSNATADKGIGTPVRPMLRDPQTGRFRSRGADL